VVDRFLDEVLKFPGTDDALRRSSSNVDESICEGPALGVVPAVVEDLEPVRFK
jgi:hypothetical protein